MIDTTRTTKLDDFSVDGSSLFRDGKLIAKFEMPVRELARLDSQLFVITEALSSHQLVRSGTNLISLDLAGRVLWKAPNTGMDHGQSSLDYFGLRIFDAAAPKLHVMFDDRGWHYFDAVSGAKLMLDPTYDWSNYSKAWQQLKEFHSGIDEAVFSSTLSFYPKLV